jgi:hypothetical protein
MIYVKVSDIIPGDKVLVKNAERGKLKPVFDPRSYIVTERKGSMITAFREEPRHTICRNSSYFKKFHEDIPGEDDYFESDETDSENSDEENVVEEDAVEENAVEEDAVEEDAVDDDTVEEESDDTEQERRYPLRENRGPPEYLRDYEQ